MGLKKAKVIMLPTQDSTNIREYGNKQGILYLPTILKQGHLLDGVYCKHLYITTGDEIKDGDWFIHDGYIENDPRTGYELKQASNNFEINYYKHNCQKIIATTDPKITADFSTPGTTFVPQIPQAFIEGYCRKGGIDEVEVEYENGYINNKPVSNGMLKVNSNNEIAINPAKTSWTREEVEDLTRDSYNAGYQTCYCHESNNGEDISLEDWQKANL